MHKLLLALCLAVFASMSQAEINTGLGHKPEGHDMGSPHQMPSGGMGNMSQMMQAPEGPIVEGEVISTISGAGYIYIEAKVDGKVTWIAGVPVELKKGDKVRFVENTVMENFTSRSLGRTFDRIVFASMLQKAE